MIVAIAAMALSSCAQPEKFDTTAVRAAIEAQNAKYVVAYNGRDAAGVAMLHTETATAMPPNRGMMKGREAIRKMTEMDFEIGVTNLTLTTVEVNGLGNTAYEIGTYTADVQPEGQQLIQDTGKYLSVWKRQTDNTWLIQVSIWNSNMPLPGM